MPQPIFHAPGHDHERCTADALTHAEALCAERAQRLTPIRRQVLEVLLESHKPLGAYEIMDRAAAHGARPAPITIYRALDFLRDNGLVHRIESRNAFVACVNNHAQRRSRGVPDLRALRRGRRGAVRRGGRSAQGRRPRGRLHAEDAGDRDHRHLRALPARRRSSSQCICRLRTRVATSPRDGPAPSPACGGGLARRASIGIDLRAPAPVPLPQAAQGTLWHGR